MTTSFEAMHAETRPLALLADSRPPRRDRSTGAGLCVLGTVVLLVLLL